MFHRGQVDALSRFLLLFIEQLHLKVHEQERKKESLLLSFNIM